MPSPAEPPTHRLRRTIGWVEVFLGGWMILIGLAIAAWSFRSDHALLVVGTWSIAPIGAYILLPLGLALVGAGALLRRGLVWPQWMVPIVLMTEVVLSRHLPPWP